MRLVKRPKRGGGALSVEKKMLPNLDTSDPLPLALPEGLPFSFATFMGLPRFLSGGKQKKSRDVKQMLG
jgi:hypothetical protein